MARLLAESSGTCGNSCSTVNTMNAQNHLHCNDVKGTGAHWVAVLTAKHENIVLTLSHIVTACALGFAESCSGCSKGTVTIPTTRT